MRNLLRANFSRLWRDKLFWVMLGGVAALLAAITLNNYIEDLRDGYTSTADEMLFYTPLMLSLAMAAFVPLHLGTEFSDGTIRNKLMVGCRRGSVYLAGFVTMTAAGWMTMLVGEAAALGLGLALFAAPALSAKAAFVLLGGAALTVTAFAALYTLIAMLVTSRAAASVVCLLLSISMLLGTAYLFSRLSEPEQWDGGFAVTADGEYVRMDPEPNPNYVSGAKRAAYDFLCDAIPTGQTVSLSSKAVGRAGRMAGCAGGLIVLCTGAGLIAFRKKDLK